MEIMMSTVDVRPAGKPADYKSDIKPIWCPGCGDYHVLMSFTRAFAELGLPPEQIVVVSGIGCSSRIPAYTNCYGFHGVHGRSLALAAGLKVTRPSSRWWWRAAMATATRSAATTSCTPAAATSI